jgi:two-component system, cell cycle sensor histidine kinase and response regulator CckA
MSSATILIVDDEPNVLRFTSLILRDAGYEVLEAGHPSLALATAERFEGMIDLLVTDVVMPGMHGPELANRIAPLRPEMRILFVSGSTPDDDLAAEVEQGTVLMLPKPFGPDALLAKVREALCAPRAES